eukprot:scpid71845/ scgid5075/ Rho GTPase-activating protein 6; Rho-type GTPase-activating protein 6; Rho-type GTPase-activating protein RhoGAPX-1
MNEILLLCALGFKDGRQPLKRGLSFRNRPKTSAVDLVEGKGGASATGSVFGIPLSQVVLNDLTMKKPLMSASTPLSDKVKGSTNSSGDGEHSQQPSLSSSYDSLSDLTQLSEASAVNSPDQAQVHRRFPTPPNHSPADLGIARSGAHRTVSLPIKGAADSKESIFANPGARASFVTHPQILEHDMEPCLPTRTFSVGMAAGNIGSTANRPPYFGRRLRSHGQVTPPPDVEEGNRLQETMHTPLSAVADSQGRSYSVDRLLEALVLDATQSEARSPRFTKKGEEQRHSAEKMTLEALLAPRPARVPVLVTAAIDFITKYGLNKVGLLRMEGARKRCRQMQDEFDAGFEIQFSKDDHHVHDVAFLLKNFFRDLPEPLLTRTLYPAFLAITKLDSKERQLHVIRLLCFLLPAANRDTLSVLLQFLHLVSQHAEDRVGEDGEEITGNKMDISNLALLMGPNILRPNKAKSGYNVAKQRHEKTDSKRHFIMMLMIEHYDVIFKVTKELHHRVMLLLQVKEPSYVDYLLKKKCVELGLDISKAEFIAEVRLDRKKSKSKRGRTAAAAAAA